MPKRALREIIIEGDVALVPLSRGKFAQINAADVSIVAGRHWHTAGRGTTFYAASNCPARQSTRVKMEYMHRLILSAGQEFEVDHVDGDGLNNRRGNLRLATRHQNAQNTPRRKDNTSGFKGVAWDKKARKWRAYIGRPVKVIGLYSDIEAAHAAYAAEAKRRYGEFARSK